MPVLGANNVNTARWLSLVERDDWQSSTTETIQRGCTLKEVIVEHCWSLEPLVTGVPWAFDIQMAWFLLVGPANRSPDVGVVDSPNTFWQPDNPTLAVQGNILTNGEFRCLRSGIVGFSAGHGVAGGGENWAYCSPGGISRSTKWKGRATLKSEDSLNFVYFKLTPTGALGSNMLMDLQVMSRCYVRVHE